MLAMAMGMKNGLTRSGPRSWLTTIWSMSVPGAAQPGADDDAGMERVLPFQAGRQAGVVHRLARGHERHLGRPVVAPDLLAVEHQGRVEVGHLAREACRSTREGSKEVMVRTPDSPATRPAQNASTVVPRGVTAPMPVTTTRRGLAHRTNLPVRMVAAR